jgi:hypothetical protein
MGAETRLVAFVCAAEILGLAGFSLVPALLSQFIATWSLSNTEAGWLAGVMSGGYMVGVLPLRWEFSVPCARTRARVWV